MQVQHLTKDHVKGVYSREQLIAVQMKGQPPGARIPLSEGAKKLMEKRGVKTHGLNPLLNIGLKALKGCSRYGGK